MERRVRTAMGNSRGQEAGRWWEVVPWEEGGEGLAGMGWPACTCGGRMGRMAQSSLPPSPNALLAS